MNDTKVNATLDGFDGPFFPESLIDFMALQDICDIHNSYAMREIASNILGFVAGDVHMTTDNYIWYYGLHFKSESGEMVILLPDFGDANDVTGRIERVRSAAVYTNGVFDADNTLQQLIAGIEERSKFLVNAEQVRRSAEEEATNAVLSKHPDLKFAFEKFAKETEYLQKNKSFYKTS